MGSQTTGAFEAAEREAVRLKGRCPETVMKIDGAEVRAIVDTGSEVTTVTEAWYRRHLFNSQLRQNNWLTLKAANGLDIPYLGLLDGEVCIYGRTCRASILVVKDSDDPAFAERRRVVPAILGMNVLGQLFERGKGGAERPPMLDTVMRAVELQQKSAVGWARAA